MIEKAKNILSESGSFGRRSFMKLAGLTSLITVLPTFKSREAHARYILNRNWWKSREIKSTAQAQNKTVEYCVQHNFRQEGSAVWSNLDNRWRKFEVRALSDDFMKWGCSERYFY